MFTVKYGGVGHVKIFCLFGGRGGREESFKNRALIKPAWTVAPA